MSWKDENDDFRKQGIREVVQGREHFAPAFYDTTAVIIHAQEGPWDVEDQVGAGNIVSVVAAGSGGRIQGLHTVVNEVQRAGLSWNTQAALAYNQRPFARFRVLMTVGSSLADAGDAFVFGLASGRNNAYGSIPTHALFSVLGVGGANLNINTESDDGTTDVAPVDTGEDFTLGVFREFEVQVLADLTIAFKIDGVRVNAGTTHTWAANALDVMPIIESQENSTSVFGWQLDGIEWGCYVDS